MPRAFLDCLRNIAQPFFTPIYDFSAPRIVHGRVALVGDAGSSSRPHMGFGVAKAGGDAQALAHALDAHDDIDTALAQYNSVRQPIGERIMLHGRKLGTHLGVDLKTDEDRRMWQLLQGYEAMMDWIAVPNFLAAYR
jgi:2-polyprenyl-6-methoxyphenol hydroxylase-like FAD-dependent oxidoreductase